MSADWLTETRESYDTVAESYTDLLRDQLGGWPLERGLLATFAELARLAGGSALDAGCGPGRITALLRDAGLDAIGVDLSPAMIAVARREHPDLRFEVGSMTALALPDGTFGGVLAWFSIIHLPDAEVPGALREFHRVLRPGGVAMLAFHLGDGDHLKTEGYGGHPMRVRVHKRPAGRVAYWLREAGFDIALTAELHPDSTPGGLVLGRRSD